MMPEKGPRTGGQFFGQAAWDTFGLDKPTHSAAMAPPCHRYDEGTSLAPAYESITVTDSYGDNVTVTVHSIDTIAEIEATMRLAPELNALSP
jgi:hypothetical protein